MERRKFIQTLARSFILAGIGAVSGYLIFKNTDGEKCDFNFICQNCNKIKKCKLPEAKEYKEKRYLNE